MRSRRRFVASVLMLALIALPAASHAVQTAAARQEGGKKAVALFVVYGTQFPNAYIVPFVLVEGGQFKPTIAGDSDPAEVTQFSKAYYGKGQKYRLLFGGAAAGTLTVQKSNQGEECSGSSADVVVQGNARFNRNVMALATDSATLGGAKGTRRPPTVAERAALMPLVRAAFKEKGTPAALLPGLMTVNLTALDLDNDGKAELVGSFVARKLKGAAAARYALFLFAEPQGNSYRTSVLQYDRITDSDLMSGADLTAIESGVYLERLVDSLDLDGDGPHEVVTVKNGFEGDTYSIYKKQGGKWNRIYEFSNYRCAF